VVEMGTKFPDKNDCSIKKSNRAVNILIFEKTNIKWELNHTWFGMVFEIIKIKQTPNIFFQLSQLRPYKLMRLSLCGLTQIRPYIKWMFQP
jgi:hypothetical protein